MTQPLWQKSDTVVDARIMRFLAGGDVMLDRELLPHDIRASRAHAAGLAAIGILGATELAALERELDALAARVERGEFVLDDRYEDGHSAIEAVLTEKLGDTGKRIHTGRSRNDQVLVASRLYLKERLQALHALAVDIATVALERAEREQHVAMPGYTHLQRAVISSAAMWWSGYAEAFIENAELARTTLAWIDSNPLGTAAGYGVNLPLARDATTEALGFARLQVSPVYAQLSRGKYEWQVLAAFAQALADVRRLAWDLSLFTTAEFGFVSLPAQYTTGSSIMPNKRNPDVVELLRASYAVVAGAMVELQSLTSLPSGYQRDLQFSKGPTLRACAHACDALALVAPLLGALRWDEAKMRAAIEPAMYATDLAIERAAAGVPFREAYREAADAAETLKDRTPEASLAARNSPGGAADLRLPTLAARLAEVRARTEA